MQESANKLWCDTTIYIHISQRHTKTREAQLGTCKAVWKRKLSLYRALLFAQRENDQTPQRFDMKVAVGESCSWRCSTPWQSVASFHVLLVPSAAFRPFTPGSGTGFAWRPWEGRGCFPTGERSSHILQEGHDEISERQRTIPQKRSRTKLTFSLVSTKTLEYLGILECFQNSREAADGFASCRICRPADARGSRKSSCCGIGYFEVGAYRGSCRGQRSPSKHDY